MVITTVYRRPRELSWCMVRMAGYREIERCVIISVCDVTLLSENIQIDTHNPDVTTSKKCNSPCPLLEGPSHASPIVMVVGGCRGCPSGALHGPLIRPCSCPPSSSSQGSK